MSLLINININNIRLFKYGENAGYWELVPTVKIWCDIISEAWMGCFCHPHIDIVMLNPVVSGTVVNPGQHYQCSISTGHCKARSLPDSAVICLIWKHFYVTSIILLRISYILWHHWAVAPPQVWVTVLTWVMALLVNCGKTIMDNYNNLNHGTASVNCGTTIIDNYNISNRG